ncbi:MAG: Cof-type HAD-IIB family hydrolase [Clostridia bacterium]|nr:Cof-type HAD-IIB family hydrolase [Clostridia bacterium]
MPKKYEGVALFSDMDGTLLDQDRNLSQENIDAVQEFIDQGGLFGVATGRMERTTILKFPQLPINTPSIFYNGACVFNTQTEEHEFSVLMPEGLEDIFIDIMDRHPTCGVEINAGGKAYVPRINDIIRIQLEREGIEGIETSWEHIPKGWYKVLLVDENDKLQVIKRELDVLDRKDINIMFSERQLLDLMAQGVSKGSTLAKLMQKHQKDWRLVAAVGDNDNDRDMVEAAHVGIAVENATASVKSVANHMISHHKRPCIPEVLRVLEQYL